MKRIVVREKKELLIESYEEFMSLYAARRACVDVEVLASMASYICECINEIVFMSLDDNGDNGESLDAEELKRELVAWNTKRVELLDIISESESKESEE